MSSLWSLTSGIKSAMAARNLKPLPIPSSSTTAVGFTGFHTLKTAWFQTLIPRKLVPETSLPQKPHCPACHSSPSQSPTSRPSVGSIGGSNIHTRLAVVASVARSADCCQTRGITVWPSIARFALRRVHQKFHVTVRSIRTQRHVEACAALAHATLGTGVSAILVDTVIAWRAWVTGASLGVVHVCAWLKRTNRECSC